MYAMPPLLTIPQAASYSGLSAYALRRLCADGTLRTVKSGTRTYIVRASLDALIGLDQSQHQQQ